jgi:hypothetical protein
MAFGLVANTPSCIRHAVWAYWDICISGLTALAGWSTQKAQSDTPMKQHNNLVCIARE